MKSYTYYILKALLSLFIVISNIFSQSGNITDYFPLQVGNVWVYQHNSFGSPPCYCQKKIRVKVTDANVNNGKTYYQNQVSSVTISCPSACMTGFLPYDSLMRVDSASGKVLRYAPGSGCITPNEVMLDSLKAKMNDTVWVYCQPPAWYMTYICADTNNVTIFGSSRQSRRFDVLGFEGGWTRTYTKGIGLTHSNCYSVFCNGSTTLLGCVINGVVYGDTGFVVGINQISSEVPDKFELQQNYPNPFNPATHFGFKIADPGMVKLTVFDALGKEVQVLVNQQLQPGSYEADWDASAYPSGVYYCRLEVNTPRSDKSEHLSQEGNFVETKKMVLIK